jgi:uncharacterized protein (TIGR01319 family)
MLLLTGGTDGGNESYAIANAEALAASQLDVPVVYAGNRTLVPEIERTLGRGTLVITDNVMPELGRLNPEPARGAIRTLFLDTIVEGKGLAQVSGDAACAVKPTPLSLYEFARVLHEVDPERALCIVDPGGATTDVYSCGQAVADPSVVLRGMQPPEVMRTVEGDVGMRVSVRSLVHSAGDYLDSACSERGPAREVLGRHVDRIAGDHEFLGETAEDIACDRLLGAACIRTGLARHAGRFREVFTPDGRRTVQTGKDLRDTAAVVLTGGFASAHGDERLLEEALTPVPADEDGPALVPHGARVLIDREYLVPLLALLATRDQQSATTLYSRHVAQRSGGKEG